MQTRQLRLMYDLAQKKFIADIALNADKAVKVM